MGGLRYGKQIFHPLNPFDSFHLSNSIKLQHFLTEIMWAIQKGTITTAWFVIQLCDHLKTMKCLNIFFKIIYLELWRYYALTKWKTPIRKKNSVHNEIRFIAFISLNSFVFIYSLSGLVYKSVQQIYHKIPHDIYTAMCIQQRSLFF